MWIFAEVLPRVKEERNILHTVKRRCDLSSWICHILLRNCLLKYVIEGHIEGRSNGKKRRKTYAAIELP
jgi:hypothetical protein